MPTPDVADFFAQAPPEALPEFARADHRLSQTGDGPLLATAQWPEPDRTSLAYPRYLLFRDRDGRLTYFQTQPEYYRRYIHSGWGVRR